MACRTRGRSRRPRPRPFAGLIKFVEDFARDNGVETLWLFTWSAEGLYAKLGWRAVERPEHNGYEVVVMNKDLVIHAQQQS